jgi:hypothetical protein
MWTLLLCLGSIADAAPVRLGHQGRLTDASGAPIDGSKNVTITLRSAADAVLFSETFPATPIQDGFFSVVLGGGATTLDSAVLTPPVYVGAAVDGVDLGGRMLLLDAPNAARAEVALRVQVEGGAAGPTCSDTGRIVYDTVIGGLRVCAGGSWQSIGVKTIVASGGTRRWSDGTTATSCLKYLEPLPGFIYAGATGNGTYAIDVDGTGALAETNVECDMTGGGWTVFRHDREARFRSQGCEDPLCVGYNVTYTSPIAVVSAATSAAAAVSQSLLKECNGSVIRSDGIDYSRWHTPSGPVAATNWPGGTTQCDLNDAVWRQSGGTITVKAQVPITRVENGDATSPEDAYFTIGTLRVR